MNFSHVRENVLKPGKFLAIKKRTFTMLTENPHQARIILNHECSLEGLIPPCSGPQRERHFSGASGSEFLLPGALGRSPG